jgi:hypothetical protein
MHVVKASVLMILAVCLLTFVGMVFWIAPPTSLDSRDVLILALAGTGIVLGGWAVRELILIGRLVRRAQAML